MKRLAFPLFFISAFAAAQAPTKVNEFTKQQQQLQQLQRNEQLRWIDQHQYQAQEKHEEITDLSTQCLPFDALEIVGVHLIDPTPLKPKTGECLNEARLNQLSKAITAAYLHQGYVYNPFQFENDGSGILRLRVTEGKVRKLQTRSRRLNLSMLFPHLLNQPLNIKVLDQGIDQANRMRTVNASVDVLPYDSGEIDLIFNNHDRPAFSGEFTLDNRNTKRYGEWQAKIGLNIDDFLGLSDSLYTAVSSTLKTDQRNFSRSLTLFHRIPYGNWSFNTLGAISGSKATITLPHSTANQRNKNWQVSVKTDYMFHRGNNHISTASVQLEHINSHNYFNDSLLELQSPELTSVQLQLNHLQLFSNSSLAFNFSYERGLNWWNNMGQNGKDQPQGRYNKWNSSLQFQHAHRWLEQTFIFDHELSGQYSNNYLPAIKQAELLGDYSVTGFKENALSAEKQIMLKNQFSWLYQKNRWQTEPYLALDMGIQKTSTSEEQTHKAIGYGAGIKLRHSILQSELGWSKGRIISDLALKSKEQNWRFSVNMPF